MKRLGFFSRGFDESGVDSITEVVRRQRFACVELILTLGQEAGPHDRRSLCIGTTEISTDVTFGPSIKEVPISALSVYLNPLDADPAVSFKARAAILEVIHLASIWGVKLVSTFAGADRWLPPLENLDRFEKVWEPIFHAASGRGIVIAFENCPQRYHPHQWPGGTNLASSPWMWRKILARFPGAGLTFDPSHLVAQGVDWEQALREFGEHVRLVHLKDATIDRLRLQDVGRHHFPPDYCEHRAVGEGEIRWEKFLGVVDEIAYAGDCIIEMPSTIRSFEDRFRALDRARCRLLGMTSWRS